MCRYFSCLVLRDFSVVWDKLQNSHEDLILKAGLKDDKLENRDFVRIEVTPINVEAPTRNLEDWRYKEDEEATLPDWYCANKPRAQKAVLDVLEVSLRTQLVLDGESIEVKDSYVVAWGNSKVDARGNSKVVARGNSKVVARDNSKVDAWDNSKVDAWDNSEVVAWGNSKVVAWGNSEVVAWDNSKVVAWDNSKVDAWGNSKVDAWDNSKVVAWGNSKITINSATSVAVCKGKIIVYKLAKVMVKDSFKANEVAVK
jgi:hypothetical protein